MMMDGHDDDGRSGGCSSPPCYADEADPDYMWARQRVLPDVRLKRVYDPAEEHDGTRVLVDRMWPRGVAKPDAKIDLWLKDLSPSAKLRQWFNHDPEKWAEFRRCYRDELAQVEEQLQQLEAAVRKGPVTLLFAARDRDHNNAVVLRERLIERRSAA